MDFESEHQGSCLPAIFWSLLIFVVIFAGIELFTHNTINQQIQAINAPVLEQQRVQEKADTLVQ